MDLVFNELEDFLNFKYQQYNQPSFIDSDPIQIPHRFSKKEDIEIAAFLTSSIAWGNRKIIIRNAGEMMKLMEWSPFDFIMNAKKKEMDKVLNFKHRTFNGEDFRFFLKSLRNIYQKYGGLQKVFENHNDNIKTTLAGFRKIFFDIEMHHHTEKHIANVDKNSAAKRLNMFLMWMVRNDGRGVHFGLWKNIESKYLKLPLDVHTANVGRKLGLLVRKQNDWLAVEEITENLSRFDPLDPVKYDFALFGLGVFEKF
ncbi:MAG: TIGR02757 family protein [Bacteroidales bacterium]